jgi:hypothetical protein
MGKRMINHITRRITMITIEAIITEGETIEEDKAVIITITTTETIEVAIIRIINKKKDLTMSIKRKNKNQIQINKKMIVIIDDLSLKRFKLRFINVNLLL